MILRCSGPSTDRSRSNSGATILAASFGSRRWSRAEVTKPTAPAPAMKAAGMPSTTPAPTNPTVATTPAGRNIARNSRWLLRVTGL